MRKTAIVVGLVLFPLLAWANPVDVLAEKLRGRDKAQARQAYSALQEAGRLLEEVPNGDRSDAVVLGEAGLQSPWKAAGRKGSEVLRTLALRLTQQQDDESLRRDVARLTRAALASRWKSARTQGLTTLRALGDSKEAEEVVSSLGDLEELEAKPNSPAGVRALSHVLHRETPPDQGDDYPANVLFAARKSWVESMKVLTGGAVTVTPEGKLRVLESIDLVRKSTRPLDKFIGEHALTSFTRSVLRDAKKGAAGNLEP